MMGTFGSCHCSIPSVCNVNSRRIFISLIGFISILSSLTTCARLNAGDFVPVSMNKVWPYHNPLETYSYYSVVPLCQPPQIEFESMSFGQILRGDRLVNSVFQISYLLPVKDREVCTITLKPDAVSLLKEGITTGMSCQPISVGSCYNKCLDIAKKFAGLEHSLVWEAQEFCKMGCDFPRPNTVMQCYECCHKTCRESRGLEVGLRENANETITKYDGDPQMISQCFDLCCKGCEVRRPPLSFQITTSA